MLGFSTTVDDYGSVLLNENLREKGCFIEKYISKYN